MRYTLQQRIKIVQLFYANNRSQTLFEQAWRSEYGRHAMAPLHQAVNALIAEFESTGSVADAPRSGRLSRSSSKQVILESQITSDNVMLRAAACVLVDSAHLETFIDELIKSENFRSN